MLGVYQPSRAELEMVSLKHLLVREENDLSTQDGLVASLVHDIYHYDYFYNYLEEPSVRRSCEEEAYDIQARLEKVKNEELKAQLQKCFDKDNYLAVPNVVDWGKYVDKESKYVKLRFSGLSQERVEELFKLDKFITDLVIKVIESRLTNKVLYSNNLAKAAEKLKEGIIWPYNNAQLVSGTISDDIYSDMRKLVNMYSDHEVTFYDFKTLYGDNADVVITEYGEIVKLRNFYFIIMFNRYF